MKKIVILVSGSGSNLQAIIENCNAKYINAEIISVISNNPNAYGLERAASATISGVVLHKQQTMQRFKAVSTTQTKAAFTQVLGYQT